MGNKLVASNQVEHFANSTEYQICVFDNIGVGSSDAPKGRYSIAEMAKDAHELLVYLHWTSQVHVVSISMGGMIALELMLLAPSMFESCMLISTHGGMSIPPFGGALAVPRSMLEKSGRKKLEILQSMLFPPLFLESPASGGKFKTQREQTFAYLANRESGVPMTTAQGASGQLAAIFWHYVSRKRLEKLSRTQIRFIVVTGTWDQLVRPTNSMHLAHHLNCPLEVVVGGGHALPSERSDWMNMFIEGHVNKTLKRATPEPLRASL
ncbi:hypothetical protein SmJEL517_g04300 [Synchytrium microbalum]|uniref:AB hydrolase-1 domain-containing protein n=1 Tax=Synchytrium microbalum TaxID=1806994 RepID=A0A507C4W8_9FUNG|nr:uncharacterized protein SmJEL517_g04300 [Synchytrium microbalum]TPX32583.1 hypothetical protein SmJEL517_g04300 [Synchytrium microbalum]